MRTFFFLLLASITDCLTAAENSITADDLLAASEQVFAERTDYRRISPSESGIGEAAVLAECNGPSASGHILKRRVDLRHNPQLYWSWRVDEGPVNIDPRQRAGDDYAARVYVVHERWPQWRSRVVSYVWSRTEDEGTQWPNPYSDRFMTLAVAGAAATTGQWRHETRNVLTDFRELHGLDISNVDAVAIMTDCDDTGQPARAMYGPMRWLPEQSESSSQ